MSPPVIHAAAAPQRVPRTILAIYDSSYQKDVRDTRIHRLLEMPLNHLGLVVTYYDLNRGLPTLEQMRDVRGILTWFQSDAMARPEEFLSWAESAIDAGKRFVLIGDLSVGRDLQGRTTPTTVVNRFLAKLGLRAESWTPVTYDVRILYQDPAMMNFERPLPPVLPPFDRLKPIDSRVRSHLIVRRGNDPDTDSHLVVTGPHGGCIANGYTHYASYRQDQLQWYLNPFEFFRLAFATDEVPKLDTNTLSGRRIYYSHIDGDGWRNQTEVPHYRSQKVLSSEVILKETILPFPDFPVTVGPIAGDLDPAWFGTRDSLDIARRTYAVPWVEAGSHTYSHPLDWETLALTTSGTASRNSLQRALQWLDWSSWAVFERLEERWSKPGAEDGKVALKRGHSELRSYDLYPFSLDQEIGGAIRFLSRLLPPGKRVELLQWSGTTMESEAVLKAVHAARVRNLNGGDTRFDPEFASYSWVAPLGRQVGAYRQVYSSDSNENTYTDLWKDRYFGFRYLTVTLRNTESPVRVKPFNLYYHMYSGEKLASLDAVLANLAFARSQELTPIAASQYAAIVEGFYSATISQMGERRWRIEDRDGLNTVRFDRADREAVDFANSVGVIGQRHFQGSLYVALDTAVATPIVALATGTRARVAAGAYLIQSRWLISALKSTGRSFTFEARGFGPGETAWQVAPGDRYSIRVSSKQSPPRTIEAVANSEGLLTFVIGTTALEPVHIEARLSEARVPEARVPESPK
jgi:polysaccharide biosynthesis protein PelA